jgi:hypothetical protein
VIGQILGESIGSGLGNFMGMYQANKSLQKVLNDPSLKNAPLEQKHSALQKALSPHGKRGESLLAQTLQMEDRQIREKEKLEALSKESKRESELNLKQKLDDERLDKLATTLGRRTTELIKSIPAGSAARSEAINIALNSLTSGTTLEDVLEQREKSSQKPIIDTEQVPEADLTESIEKPKEYVESPPPQRYGEKLSDYNKRVEKWLQTRRSENVAASRERALPYLKEIDAERAGVRSKDLALSSMRDAIKDGDLDFFSKDNLANFLGKFGEGLRTSKGAELINAQKEFLLGNISRAGSRPNMYIEQQIVSMMPKLGRSVEANETIVEGLDAEQKLVKEKIRLTDELEEKYQKELGYVPPNIAAVVDKELDPIADKIKDRLSYRVRTIQENEMGDKKLRENLGKRVPRGTPLTLRMAKMLVESTGSKKAALSMAESLGYRVPSTEEYRMYLNE